MTITPDDLIAHAEWVRDPKQGVRIVRCYANLSGANLRDADLLGANLRRANLRCASDPDVLAALAEFAEHPKAGDIIEDEDADAIMRGEGGGDA